MAAILVLELFSGGDHLNVQMIYMAELTRHLLLQQNKGLKFSYVDTRKSFKQYIRPQTKAVFIETPSNPTMKYHLKLVPLKIKTNC